MVIDACLNMEGDHNKAWNEEWRCLNCGEIFDLRIMENRALQRQTRYVKWAKHTNQSLAS